MGHLPFAFSVHHFINSVGSDAGFASIIGLAVLVLLYFSHARETASLREEAEAAAHRVQELEARLAGLSRQPAPARPPAGTPVASRGPGSAVPSGTPAPVSAAGVAVAQAGGAIPGAPAGVAAPPLTAATRLIPAGAPPGSSEPAPPSGSPSGDGEGAALSTAAPASTTTGGNGTGEYAAPTRAPSPVRQPMPARAAPSATTPRTGALPPRAPISRRAQDSTGGLRRYLPLVIGGLVLIAVVVVLLIATSGGTKTQSTASTPVSNAPAPRVHHARPASFTNSSATVAVLNGTPTTGLAARTSTRLTSAGFKAGKVASASDQTRTATVVAYLPGHRQDALAVAKSLKLGSASVQPVDPGTQAIACPPPASCSATVVVTVGSDLANQ